MKESSANGPLKEIGKFMKKVEMHDIGRFEHCAVAQEFLRKTRTSCGGTSRLERSRRGIMDEQRRFIEADNHSAVDVKVQMS